MTRARFASSLDIRNPTALPTSTPAPAEEQPEWQSESVDFGHELKFAVDSMLQAYHNRFRILILGRSGVGKSNLINAIFGTDFATVKYGREASISNIGEEITSPLNPRLILHDSQGFSHGCDDNFNIVKDFIKTHSQMTNLKDRLHAIWLCSTVPTYGGSLLGAGEEEILQMKDYGVPIVAVFTKYDVLVESLKPPDDEDFYGDITENEIEIRNEIENPDKDVDPDMGLNTGTSTSPIDPHVLSLAENMLCEMVTPFQETLGVDVPWVRVSVKPAFSDTLDELVDVTRQRIDSSLKPLWAITQQQSVVPKIKASIEIGKKRYWQGLSTGLILASGGKSLEKMFKVIHKDIVTIWSIYDPMNVFTSAAKEMSELQQDLVEVGGGSVVRNIRGMMGYIVDLTVVMQSLSFLMQARTEASGSHSPVNERVFKVALDAYKQDTEHSLQKVHNEIRSFATVKKAIFQSETVMKEVERLINVHRFKPSERFMAQARANTLN